MNTDGVGLIFVILFLACCMSAFVVWIFAAYHLFKTTNNFKPEKEWGRFIPFSLFMPTLFTETGNVHRAKFLRATGYFVLLIATGFGLGLINEALK
jgi:hypothetical protein